MFKKLLTSLALGVCLLMPASAQQPMFVEEDPKEPLYLFGTIEKVTSEVVDESYDAPLYSGNTAGGTLTLQEVTISISSDGEYKGDSLTVDHTYSGSPREVYATVGEQVVVQVQDLVTGEQVVSLVDYDRTWQSWFYLILFAIVLIFFGRWSGVRSLAGLVFTFLVLFWFFIPLLMQGHSPIGLAIIATIIITIIVHLFVAGTSAKSLSSMVGTIGGTVVAGCLGLLFTWMSHLNGLSSEEARSLFFSVDPTFDYTGIFLAGVMIGALGAVMDVGISISSSIKEVKDAAPHSSFQDLVKVGMNVGKDILGTMSNTLILAYIGAGIPLVMLLISAGSVNLAMNFDFIAEEIVRSIAGSIGLFATIPITAYISAFLELRNQN